MSNTIRIALDAMGGDHGPATVVPGAALTLERRPDARFVITSMQENALHGWRLQPDKGHMRMSGYPGKVRSLSWSADGKSIAFQSNRGGFYRIWVVGADGANPRPLTKGQAEYLGVDVAGPYKPEHYRY